MKKILSILLSVCMLLGMCGIFSVSFAEEPAAGEGGTDEEPARTISWDNGSIDDAWVSGEWDGSPDAAKYKYDDTVFKYVYFYGGTNPNQNQNPVGFYDMVKAADGKWRGVANEADHPDGNLYNTYSGPAMCWSTWHYTPGVCFTAPETGTVEFTYQYANLHNGNDGKYTFVVVRENADLRDLSTVEAIASNTTKKAMGFSDSTPNEHDEVTFRVDVQKGENLYFVACALEGNATGVKALHWISSARYVAKESTLLGHGLAANDTLDLRFLVQITDPDAAPTATAVIKAESGDQTVIVKGEPYYGPKKDGGTYTIDDHVFAFTVELSAKQTTDEVLFTFETVTDTYTVQEYCLGIQEKAKTDTSYTTAANTCAGILLYGYLAQIHFDYRTDKLPQVNKALLSEILDGIQ